MLSVRHEVFIEVAFNLSFSKASNVLFISQPAISKHIKALEEYYKTTLFERKGNAIKLSVAGEILYTRLREAKNIQKQLEFEMSTLKDQFQAKGQLKLGASTTVALYILPRILSGFHQKHPEVKISLLNRNTDTIIKALLEQDIDVGIVEGKNKISSILYQPFMTDEVVAVCSAKSSIARKPSLTIQDLLQYPIALREQGSGTLEALKYMLKKHGIKLSELKVGVRLAGTEALKNFLREDYCLGFLPRRSVIRELNDGELVAVKIEKLQIIRDFNFIQRQGSENDGLNKAFIRFSKMFYNE
ncbi:MAG TPA: LysR family transcriptional regulator [Chitinophagaceae bacterium]|jgi:DNA-binding transcriptional LysR family regulator|nr:LysR family transcriptional regulator [Chitinophagaceae bacterium]